MFGYLPEPEKYFAICPLVAEELARPIFAAADFPVRFCRGHRYVGGFVGSRAMQDWWVEPMMASWVCGIEALSRVARKYLQSAYYGLLQSLQAEWTYFSRFVPDVSQHLFPIEEAAIQEELIPALFNCDMSDVLDDFRQLLSHGAKQGGTNLQNPAAGAERLHQASLEARDVLVASLLRNTTLDSVEHKQCVRKAGAKAQKERLEAEQGAVMEMMMVGASKQVKKRPKRTGKTGKWLTIPPNKLDGTLLSKEEWRDNARLRYRWKPLGLCSHCGRRCGAGFTVEHGLSCKKGGLAYIHHDDARDEAGSLAAMVLTKSKLSYGPTFFYDRGVTASQLTKTRQTGSNMAGAEARGNVKIHWLWEKESDCILDICTIYTDSKSYQNIALLKVLERAAKVKKDKYLTACLERRHTFMPFVYSVDGMACKEALAFEKCVVSLLASKWN